MHGHRSVSLRCSSGVRMRILLCGVLVAGCLVGCKERPTLREQREANAPEDLERHTERQLAFSAPLTREEVVAFAIEHNLDAQLQERRNEIEREKRTQAWLRLLPQLQADFDYSRRGSLPASRSTNVNTGEMSDEYTYSTPKSHMTYGIEMMWNLLDFGISYNLARQASSQAEIAKQELRRSRQNLALNVNRQYWRAQVAGHAARNAQSLIDELVDRRKRLQERLDDATIPQREGLRTKREILGALNRLRAFAREEEAAKAELRRLMGLGPDATFELASVEFPRIEDFARYDVAALEEEALESRPELYREDLQESISRDAVHIAALNMLPSPAAFLRHDWDDNPHLKYRHWRTVGVRSAWDLLNIPEQLLSIRIEKMRRELVRQRRTAQAVGVLTQLRMAVIQYHQAAETTLENTKVYNVQAELTRVIERLVRQGKANEGELLNARLERFFASMRHARAYADLALGEAQIRNAVGRDPAPLTDPLPVAPIEETEEGRPVDDLVRDLRRIAERKDESDVRKTAADEDAEGEPGLRRAVPPQAATLPPEKLDLLDEAVRRLESGDYVKALEAKHMLISAGEAGAALALEMLNSYERRARILAILIVREAGSARMVASLLPALEDPDPRIRYQAVMALREVFQQNFGFIHDGREVTREAAIARWRDFLFAGEPAPAPAGTKTETPSAGAAPADDAASDSTDAAPVGDGEPMAHVD